MLNLLKSENFQHFYQKLSINFRFFLIFLACLILTHGHLGFERSVWISSSFIPWGLCVNLYCSGSFHTYDTSALKSSAWDFIFFHSLWLCADQYCTQTVPLHRHLSSWKQCMRFNFMPTFTPWGLCWVCAVFKQLLHGPYIGHLGSWELCMRFLPHITSTPW